MLARLVLLRGEPGQLLLELPLPLLFLLERLALVLPHRVGLHQLLAELLLAVRELLVVAFHFLRARGGQLLELRLLLHVRVGQGGVPQPHQAPALGLVAAVLPRHAPERAPRLHVDADHLAAQNLVLLLERPSCMINSSSAGDAKRRRAEG